MGFVIAPNNVIVSIWLILDMDACIDHVGMDDKSYSNTQTTMLPVLPSLCVPQR